LLAKLVPIFEDRGCSVVSAADRCGRNLGFLDRKIQRLLKNNFILAWKYINYLFILKTALNNLRNVHYLLEDIVRVNIGSYV
jgi:hypothetical protein